MQTIDIQPLPNQEFTIDLNGQRVDLAIRTAINTMVADVTVDDVVMLRGVRLVAGEPAIPYPYLSVWGNLVLMTTGDELPWWEQFGVSQTLYYLTPDEMATVT
jgi:hypothetical protein